ncbi:hypothetical protein [Prosthecomicrobium hirschii]|uniref:Sulfur globule protein n=1 Tax=Prosthecodimorpha hirschii TaxID=665126 RepID=A0A0N8GF25_9HYPH|nr:hypothetical protein [Prosthecomicrobium hirschii]KPL53137.1 hypothetical protein ABB55_13690 [Prosthecomicrobium hirschii]MCW1842139.1 sulfur globule protein precursor [Prosthecomicrobium hirschii]
MKKLVLGLAAATGLALATVPVTTTTAEAGWKHNGHHGGHKWHGHHGHWHGGKVVVRPWGYPAYYGYGYPGCRWKVKYRGHHAYKVKVCY